ncbi:hypothetical protein INT48_005348 [Thamnidium elegans]|uniref:Uncharacterized protein n=1 Tax=Thamnidium elegans TaxID=101142 RepID=A0A8H7VNR5_9FUNG|nr:hypothetical protein INT48_005348 [Thamnidium elegans]
MNRITIKQNRPKLGLFNKGKSSAQATKTDLVFSETKFLKKRKQDSHSPDTLIQKKKKRENKSKFFKQKSEPKSDTLTPVNYNTTISPHRSSSHKQINSELSSNQSIKRILKECQDAPQVILDYYSQHNSLDNYYSYYDTHESDRTVNRNNHKQVPIYAPVKTPRTPTVHEPVVISETNSSNYHKTSSHELSNNQDTKSPADLEDALTLFYKSHNIIQPANACGDDGLVDWQIESLSNSLEDTKEEYSNDILNFWEYQYKRTL